MRRIRIPVDVLHKWMASSGPLVLPVCVDWPELRLTDDQIAANAMARAAGAQDPYLNPQVFDVLLDSE